MRDVSERFMSKVDKSEDCWRWLGFHSWNGYGGFKLNGRNAGAHRVAYELLVGPIPDGMQIDHLCRNRGCVNPAHMEPVTPRENTLRGASLQAQNARKTHCPQGHEYTAGNTYTSGGGRKCKACAAAWKRRPGGKEAHRLYMREWSRRKRDEASAGDGT